jgi:hypothetical protein
MPFKLPAPMYAERVFALATPPFHKNYKIGELITRNRTPPCLSNLVIVLLVNWPEMDRKAVQLITSKEFRSMIGCE